MRFFSSLAALFLGVTSVFADPVITEFMASNKDGLADEDGDHSDWLEIHNPDPTPVSLNNWSLTDNASNLRKWIFPNVSIPANGYLIVFASNKNRRVPGQPLHTNFALSADGEYLALTKPDGSTRTTEFAPGFPPQYPDVSYGESSSTQTVTLLKQGSPARGFAAANDSLGDAWYARGFNDGGWAAGALGAGYFNSGGTSNPNLSDLLGLNLLAYPGNQNSMFVRAGFEIPDPAKVYSLRLRMLYDDGFIARLNGQPAASGNAPLVAAYNTPALGNHPPTGYEEFDLGALIPQLVAGTNVLAMHALNATPGSSDLFLLPELTAEIDTGAEPQIGYFGTATPGGRNGGPNSLQLPQVVAVSRPSGTFTATFSLTLSGAVAGQQIRYGMADPSAFPGANVPEPTAESSVYGGPLAIAGSKVIRAAVFDATGRKGVTRTVQYLRLETATANNTSNFTSNLPLIVTDTHGAGQPPNDQVTSAPAFFYLFDTVGGTASLNSTPTFFSRQDTRVRGRSSSGFPKKSFRVQLRNEANSANAKSPLLGLAEDDDWQLIGPWRADSTFLHNAFAYELGRRTGHWAAHTRFVEVFANFQGARLDYQDYNGVYVLTEKIESGKDRLDITPIGPGDVSGDALTGGYIFRIDDPDPGDVSWRTTRNLPAEFPLMIVEPDPDDDNDEQINYLKNYIQAFEDALFGDEAAGFTRRDYRRYIDVPSWIDHHIMNAITSNIDALRLSANFHKDRNQKIHAGPLWDFDIALNSKDGRDANPRGWTNIEYYFTRDWWGKLFRDPDFVQAWIDRWYELRADILSNASLNALADQMAAEIGNAAGGRDAARWPDNAPPGADYLSVVTAMKTWLTSTASGSLGRAPWLDTQIPAPPTTATASGVVAAGTTVALSGSGSIRYNLNGSDPRQPGGGLATSSSYSQPIVVNQTVVLKARRRGAFAPFPSARFTNWSAPLTRVYLVNESFAAAGDIAVSEINYRPAEPTADERAAILEVSAKEFEFLELRNVGTRVVNTFELEFADGLPVKKFRLDPLTLAPGDTALVVRNREAFLLRYGAALAEKIVGEWGDMSSLANEGEEIRLLARDGSPIQAFTYADLAAAGRSLNRSGSGAWTSDLPSPGDSGPTYPQWKAAHFPEGGELAADDADGDDDQADNRVEYARGTNPKVHENQTLLEPKLTLADGKFTFTYQKPTNRPSARYAVEQSGDLGHWTPLADTLKATNGTVETRAVEVSAAGAPSPQYFRLKVTLIP